ncbi:MAG: 4-deoxy-4-formamido-L-arabinose-phosphoundecaprenol deformylase [Phycisphaerales bacterium]|nr:4-deoxy-4-formamido-L-arabinose-phosphoundecaprenol deformylase [Phycisphaerales bacterium]
MKLGLRIDVDTYRGTRDGLPALCRLLDRRGICASIFLTAGPDNMGRHLRRLLRPSFLQKMLRSRAGSIYGWDILLRGTIWPGPVIHRRLAGVFKDVARQGHEVGVHAWDHHWWQMHASLASSERVHQEVVRAHEAIAEAIGTAPTCAAAPGWRCTESMLSSRGGMDYSYVSDCRGEGVFQPSEGPPQICVNLPTWDETVGRNGVTNDTWNEHVLSLMKRDDTDVLTIHAESEGGSMQPLFEDFLDRAQAAGAECVPLGSMIPDRIETDSISRGSVPGREGWVAVRGSNG